MGGIRDSREGGKWVPPRMGAGQVLGGACVVGVGLAVRDV